jgi:hypothetical protein
VCGSLLLQVQSQAGDEGTYSGVDEEWQTQNPRLLLGMQYQDVQVGEEVRVKPGGIYLGVDITHKSPREIGGFLFAQISLRFGI